MLVRGFRRQWLASVLALAAALGSCRSSTPMVADAGSPALSSASRGPSVWSVDLMTVLPGEHDRYRRFIDANWARARRTAREQGQILSYHALFRPDTAQGNWHVILLTQYPDSAAFERREEIFQPILRAQGHTRIDGKSTRELTSTVDYHTLVRLFGEP
ncbi:MAG TPA: hypothetical protein VFZ21_11460 [Gemmatimonadaceae bacterium]|jgi:hypothetical protein|nr:hypothetical protein [Gemmatimonadaceae bacterium]